MFETVIVVLMIMWVLGIGSSVTFGGLLHILPILALSIIIVRIIQGRKGRSTIG